MTLVEVWQLYYVFFFYNATLSSIPHHNAFVWQSADLPIHSNEIHILPVIAHN